MASTHKTARAVEYMRQAVDAGVRQHRGWRKHTRALALSCALTVVCWDVPALAINALVSHDLPALTKIAASEAKAVLELGKIVTETRAIVGHAKEVAGLTKAAYRGLEELRSMTWNDLRSGVVAGLGQAFPEAVEIYKDVQSIRDLRRVDPRSVETLRNILWQEVYGPAVDGLIGARENSEAIARARDVRTRQGGLISALRVDLGSLEKNCDLGEGACQAAANRAEIKQTLLLTDMQEALGSTVELLERDRIAEDTKTVVAMNEFDRFLTDFDDHLRLTFGGKALNGRCRAGDCIRQQYEGARSRVISDAHYRQQGYSGENQ